MSADSLETDQPPAVSTLRSKFEKLAQDTSSSSTPSTLPGTHDSNYLLSPWENRHRAFSNSHVIPEIPPGRHLRSSSSSSDLKRRPPPPPPVPRSLKPSLSPVLRPTPASSLSTSVPAIIGLDKPALITRKPPPPPVAAQSTETAGADLSGLPSGGVASLRSRFANAPTSSLPCPRQPPPGNRVVSHSSTLTPTFCPQATEPPHRQQWHAPPELPDMSPLIRFDDAEQPAPPLPSRPPPDPFEINESNPPSRSSSLDSNGSSSSGSSKLLQRSPPSPPKRLTTPIRPPPRHTSLPSPSVDTILSHSNESDGNSDHGASTPTLQVPPPLPARRSSPSAAGDLPRQGRAPIRAHSLQDIDPHSGIHSAPPTVERKPVFAPPPVRTIALGDKLPPARRPASNAGSESDSNDDDESLSKTGRTVDLPDASHSSRRPPNPSAPAFARARIHVTAHTGVIAVAGSHVVVAHHHVKVFDLTISESPLQRIDLKEAGFDWRGKDPRVTCMEFRPAEDEDDRGRFVWLGTKDGTIWELDLQAGGVTTLRPAAHSAPVTHLFRQGHCMVSLDENGKVLVFSPESDHGGCAAMLTHSAPRVVRITEKQGFAKILGGLLWTSGGPGSGSSNAAQVNGNGAAAARGPTVRVFDIMAHSVAVKSLLPLEHVGAVTSGTVLQMYPDKVYLGHEGGFITIWDLKSEDGAPACAEVVKVSVSDVLCLEGVNDRLWAGSRKGVIMAYDVEQRPWVVTNSWKAHTETPVQKLLVDPYSIEKCGQLSVISVGRDEQARFWDGLLGVDWIDNELLKRESSFSSFRALKVLVVSWNVDAAKPDQLTGCADNTNFLSNVLGSVDSPDIIAFGFQELIDLESRKMAAKTVLLGGKKKTDGSISEKVSRSYKMWYDRLTLAVRLAMPPDCPYTVVHTENLVGLFTCIFVKNSMRGGLKDVAITTVKRGIGGIYGNKGGIVARLVVDDSSICFINCHLAAGQHHVRARNADVAALTEDKEVFPPSSSSVEPVAYVGGGDGSMVLDHEIVFLNGDLNYRIDQRREAILSTVHAGGPLEPLLAHDQLLKEMRLNRGFRLRAFAEAPIAFAPTYKYDRRAAAYDSSEKARAPAWCDRILHRARDPARVQSLHYRRYEPNVSDHRPVSAGFRVTVKSVDHAARARVKAEVEGLWLEQQLVLLSGARQFFLAQEIV